MTESVGFSEKRGSFRNEMFEKRYEATPRKNDRIQQNASVFQTKTFHFRVIARPQRGRGNLKAKGMASRYEARKQKPTKFQNSDPSRRDTAIALHLGRYIIRPRGRISYAAAYIMQRSCISLRSPASPSPHFTHLSLARSANFTAQPCRAYFRFSSQMSRTAMSAGETPEMRLACPMLCGRIALSFCRASRRSPWMPS